MVDLPKLIESISGEKPTPDRIARIQAIAHLLEIPAGDAMFPILVALDAYYGALDGVPVRITSAANDANKILEKITDKAAEDATEKVKDKIETAVGALAPAVKSAVEEAAKGAVLSVTTELNVQNVLAGTVIASLIFAAGVFEGAGILRVLMWGRVSLPEFTSLVGWGIGAGVVIFGLGLWSGTAFESKRVSVRHKIAGVLAGALAAVMLFGAIQSAIHFSFRGVAGPIDPHAVLLTPLPLADGR
jgi:hypothetical protein